MVAEKRELAVAATDDEGEHAELWLLFLGLVICQFWVRADFGDEIRVDMTFDMVDSIERFLVGNGKRTSSQYTYEQAATKACAVSDGDGIDITPGAARLGDGLADDGVNAFYMAARCYLWYDAALLRV